LGFVAVVAALSPVFGALVTTNIFVVTVDDPLNEDQYVTSMSAVIEGVIDGDLTIFTGNLTISGEVTGSVQVMSSGTVTITETGRIGGALRGAAVNVRLLGDVAGDVFITSGSIVLEESGVVESDLMAFGGVVRVEGNVERDVRGRMVRTVVTGDIGGDIDVATQKFEVGPTAEISGDILYRSPSEGSISPDANITGTVTRLPSQSNFVYGLILSLANVVGVLAFLVAGIVILLLVRGTGSRATGSIITNPIRSLLYGIVAVIVTPVLIVFLGATLVGLPIAVMLVMLLVASVVLGPVPAVAAFGNRIMFRRGGLLGAFVVGAILWRLGIWLIPVVGGALYLLALVWGIGGWIAGAIASRRSEQLPMALLPAAMTPTPAGIPADWKPPFAPGYGVGIAPRAAVATLEAPEATFSVDDDQSAVDETGASFASDDVAAVEDDSIVTAGTEEPDGEADLHFGASLSDDAPEPDSQDVPEPDLPEPDLPDLPEKRPDDGPSGDDWGLPSR
jgi:cytoskeletal protein CcmA (bactofilin family)